MTFAVTRKQKQFFPVEGNDRMSQTILKLHYEKTRIQMYSKFYVQKLKFIRKKKTDIFHISAQNIDCGYSLEPTRRDGSNEYLQSMVEQK